MNFDAPDTLAKLKTCDDGLFSQLVAHHHNALITVARAIIGEALADEVVQEGWLLAYKALPDFEGRSKLKTWLITIVSNHAKTRLRKENRTVSLDTAEESGADFEGRFKANGHWASPVSDWHCDSPDGLLEGSQLNHCIEYTLSILPPQQKAVFTLRDLEQVSLQEICNTLAVSESNVRVLLHRARAKLYQVIERYQETGEC